MVNALKFLSYRKPMFCCVLSCGKNYDDRNHKAPSCVIFTRVFNILKSKTNSNFTNSFIPERDDIFLQPRHTEARSSLQFSHDHGKNWAMLGIVWLPFQRDEVALSIRKYSIAHVRVNGIYKGILRFKRWYLVWSKVEMLVWILRCKVVRWSKSINFTIMISFIITFYHNSFLSFIAMVLLQF